VGYLVDAEATIAALQARVQELEHRLEIDVALDVDGNEIPAPLNMPDGIYCRDATIQLQNEALSELESQLTQRTAELEAAKASRDQFQRVADMRGQAILTLTEKWAERRAYHRTQFKAVVKLKNDLQAELERVRAELAAMRQRKDGAYLERNRVVAALASCFPSGIAQTAIEGWDEEWHGCVYIDLPTGQAAWHYHDSHAYLFAHLPPYTKPWDGHTTEEKYERVALLQHRQGMGGK